MPIDKLQTVDIDTVAANLLVTDRQVRTWIEKFGLPSTKDGRTRTFYWPDVLEWYVGYRSAKDAGPAGDFAPEDQGADGQPNEDQRQANLRKTRAEADLKQLQLAKARGQMIGIREAGEIVNRVFGNVRSQLLNMAPKLSTLLTGQPEEAVQGIIKTEMETLCRELSTGQVVGIEESQPAAETEDEPVDLEASAMPGELDAAAVAPDLRRRITRAYGRL
jgi:hypothetical protein